VRLRDAGAERAVVDVFGINLDTNLDDADGVLDPDDT
jgi:hypothetical protein